MGSEGAQRREDADVVLVVRTQLEAVALGDDQRQFEDVDRIEAEAFAEQRRVGVDVAGGDVEIERADDQFGDFGQEGGDWLPGWLAGMSG